MLLLAAAPVVSAEAESTGGNPEQVYGFGLHLLRLGDYYRAVTELKRFTLLFPRHQQHDAAQVLIGLALQSDAAYNDALAHFQWLSQFNGEAHAAQVASFKLGEIPFSQGQYRLSARNWQRFLNDAPQGPLARRSAYLLGLSWWLDGQHTEASGAWSLLRDGDPLSERASALRMEARQLAPPLHKSPAVAGVLSGVLPGAGHLYIGKPLQALTAFLLNGLFLAGAAYAVHEGLEGTAAILLFFETGWYLGTINSARAGAQEFNRRQRQAATDRLLATYSLPPLDLEQLQLPALGLRVRF
jgi:TolA-binding protein/TM2 domain-containing membrane protein YozV